ncbi:transcriptional activator domain-containing protein [Mesobacillus persicus]|uniref:Transcriptional activator domain-containing protein n=1 Tax=Mesobacillus persicus TaxID=930146 RepID=A0A1H7WLY6_9BACI|nr:BTAD domain-containing putative transcriptional regulator [Mesobacillus persicus]SEM22049.1 transcriptional activator domain-containing protein [Mesobacillus persicus]
MKKQIQVMKTKLMAPRFKEDSIRRAKLTKKMKAFSDYPLTLVHSSAGYGKSTALALYVSDEQVPCCWYSISAADDDMIPFLTYIVSAIRTVIPNFGAELSEYMEQMDPYLREDTLDALCSLFINDVVAVDEEIILILDDYHQVEHSYNVNSWMEKLIEHIPDNFHVIVSSRSRPRWNSLSKMKVSDQLLEITKEDLVLTKDEIELFLCDYYGIDLNEEQLETVFNITEGWVIALGMIAQQLNENTDFEAFSHISIQTLDHLFHYLAREVFEQQPPMVQQFLEQTSVFDEMDKEICESVLGMANSEGMLQQISDHNLFVQKIGEQQYRYHALFKEFLEEQLKKNQPRSYTMLHESCARFYEKRQQFELALAHYQKIQSIQASAALLHEYGPTMLKSGKLESLYERLTTIPEQVKDEFYTLWLLQGEVLRYRSLYNEAEVCYDRAIVEADKRRNPFVKSKSLEGKAKIYLDTIQPENAERLLNQAMEFLENSDYHSEEDRGMLYRLLAENLINLGQGSKAEKWMNQAQSVMNHQVDVQLEARLYLRTGRLDRARNILLATKNKEAMKVHLPQSHRETDLLLALIEAFIGNGAESKSLAQEGIQNGIEIESPYVEACGWIRMGHAIQLLDQYDASLAIKCYETALEMMEAIQVERGKAEPLMGLCLLYGRKGEYERAIEAGNAALQETDRVKDLWLSSFITLSLGIAAAYHRNINQALSYLEKAEKMFTLCNDSFGQMLSYLWLTYCSYLQDNDQLYERNLTSLLRQVEQGNYEFIFQRKTVFGPRDLHMLAPMLIEAGKKSTPSTYVSKLLQDMELTHLKSHPGYTLRIDTLGPFKVWLGDREVEEKDWQRGKAKELLQLFTTRPFHLFPKEEIFHKLWPEQDEKNAARDFKVALNALNKVLEPKRKARETPFFVIRDGTSYGLNHHAGIELDSIQFEEWINRGLAEQKGEMVSPFLEKGLQLYKGDYLRDRRYEDWCLNERERLQVLFLRASEKLAQNSVRIEDYDKAIYWCETILEKDRTWEEAYRLLMFCYYRKNNRPFAMKWYQKCCKILEDELGVTPLEPTRQMYEMILAD